MNLQDLKKKKPPELLAFAEEQGVEADCRAGGRRSKRGEVNARADQSRGFVGDRLADAAFGERDSETATAAIMRALEQSRLGET